MATLFWLVAFDSTHHALKAEAELEGAGLEIDIRPTPKSVTAGCALSIDYEPGDHDAVRRILLENEVVVRGYFKPDGDAYVPVES